MFFVFHNQSPLILNYVWINSELKKGMRDRDAAKRKAIADWAKYKKMRNKINNNIKLLKHLIILMLLVNLKVILE